MLPPTIRTLLKRDVHLHCHCTDSPAPQQQQSTTTPAPPITIPISIAADRLRYFLSAMATRAEGVTTGCGGFLCALTRRFVRCLPRRVAEPTGPLDVILDIFLGLIVAKGATRSQLAAIPTSVVSASTASTSTCADDRCPICLGSFEDGDVTKVLACSHTFHAECIDCWLMRKSLCPTCKADVC